MNDPAPAPCRFRWLCAAGWALALLFLLLLFREPAAKLALEAYLEEELDGLVEVEGLSLGLRDVALRGTLDGNLSFLVEGAHGFGNPQLRYRLDGPLAALPGFSGESGYFHSEGTAVKGKEGLALSGRLLGPGLRGVYRVEPSGAGRKVVFTLPEIDLAALAGPDAPELLRGATATASGKLALDADSSGTFRFSARFPGDEGRGEAELEGNGSFTYLENGGLNAFLETAGSPLSGIFRVEGTVNEESYALALEGNGSLFGGSLALEGRAVPGQPALKWKLEGADAGKAALFAGIETRTEGTAAWEGTLASLEPLRGTSRLELIRGRFGNEPLEGETAVTVENEKVNGLLTLRSRFGAVDGGRFDLELESNTSRVAFPLRLALPGGEENLSLLGAFAFGGEGAEGNLTLENPDYTVDIPLARYREGAGEIPLFQLAAADLGPVAKKLDLPAKGALGGTGFFAYRDETPALAFATGSLGGEARLAWDGEALSFRGNGLEVDALAARYDGPFPVSGGRLSGSAELAIPSDSLEGKVALDVNDTLFKGHDLDRLVEDLQATGELKWYDLGAYYLLGPLGLLVSQGAKSSKAVLSTSGGQTAIPRTVLDAAFHNGVFYLDDVAFATTARRIAAKGRIDLPNRRLEEVTVAAVDRKGCPQVLQKVTGTFEKPKVDLLPLGTRLLSGTVSGAVEKAASTVSKVATDCQPFYTGRLAHPKKTEPAENGTTEAFPSAGEEE